MTSRSAARDAAVRAGSAITSAAVVVTLAATGSAVGTLARPETLVPQADPSPQPVRPKRLVYVQVPAPERIAAPVRRSTLRPPTRPIRRAVAPPVTTSSGS